MKAKILHPFNPFPPEEAKVQLKQIFIVNSLKIIPHERTAAMESYFE